MEPFKDSFYNIAVQAAGANPATAASQKRLIDNVTAESPILAGLPFEQASHNYHNVFERVTDATGIDTIDFDGPLPEINSETQLDQVNLTPLGGILTFGEDRATAYGGKEAYLEKKIPAVLRKSGNKIERALFLDNFLGNAVRWNKVYSATETPTDEVKYSAMVAITWVPGEMTGLFSPLPYQEPRLGRVFETKWVNGGNTFLDIQNVNGKDEKIISYSAYVKTVFGMQLENSAKIAALVNIEGVPTAKQLVALTEYAQASASTRIYMTRAKEVEIATYYSQQNFGNGLISVLPGAKIAILGVPAETSYNIPAMIGKIDAPYLS